MKRTIKKQLIESQPAPLTTREADLVWSGVTAELGLTTPIAATVSPVVTHIDPFFLRHPGYSFATIAVVLSVGFSVHAADRAIPGDLFYSLDLALEKAALAITAKDQVPAREYQNALERIAELNEWIAVHDISLDPSSPPPETLAALLRTLESYLSEHTAALTAEQQAVLSEAFQQLVQQDGMTVGEEPPASPEVATDLSEEEIPPSENMTDKQESPIEPPQSAAPALTPAPPTLTTPKPSVTTSQPVATTSRQDQVEPPSATNAQTATSTTRSTTTSADPEAEEPTKAVDTVPSNKTDDADENAEENERSVIAPISRKTDDLDSGNDEAVQVNTSTTETPITGATNSTENTSGKR